MNDLLLQKANKIIVFDGFNRADNASSLGNADTGQAWTNLAGKMGLSGNQAYGVKVDTLGAFAVIDAGISDCIINYLVPINLNNTRFPFRVQDAQNQLFLMNTGGYILKLNKRVNNTVTELASVIVTLANSDLIRVQAHGNNIKVFVNGELIIDVNESSFATATKHGLQTFETASRYDNFSVEAI